MRKIPLLFLAAALTVALTGCGPPPPAPTQGGVSTPAPATAPPAATRAPETPALPTASQSAEHTRAPETASPTPAHRPTSTPAPRPTQAPPQPTPAPARPTPTPPAEEEPTAAQVYEAVSAAAGGSAMVDMSFALTEFYQLGEEDLAEYVLYMPDMSATLEEIFIARMADGKSGDGKAACESRLQGLREQVQFYPDTGAYVETARIVTEGDWVALFVCENPDGAVEAFQTCVK